MNDLAFFCSGNEAKPKAKPNFTAIRAKSMPRRSFSFHDLDQLLGANEAQAKARNFPVTSIGSLLDEPFTGVVYLKDSGITTDFRTLKGKRIGYVGEFGKVRQMTG